MADQYEQLDYAEIWHSENFRVWQPPGFLQAVEIDMTKSKVIVERLRESGIKGTYTHLFVRAVAIALTRHPELHQLVAGTRRLYPERIDICLSVAGKPSFAPPVMIIEDAGKKNLRELADEIVSRTPEIKGKEPQAFPQFRKWGWLVPIGAVRRSILSFLWEQLWFRRQNGGTFAITCLPNVDVFASFTFTTSAIVSIGRVKDRVVAIDGQPVVRPTVTIVCCADHKAWDGIRGATFLTELNKILAEGELEAEST